MNAGLAALIVVLLIATGIFFYGDRSFGISLAVASIAVFLYSRYRQRPRY